MKDFDLAKFVPPSADILYQKVGKKNWAMLYLFLCDNVDKVVVKVTDVCVVFTHLSPPLVYQMLERFVSWGYLKKHKGNEKCALYLVQKELVKKPYIDKAKQTLIDIQFKVEEPTKEE